MAKRIRAKLVMKLLAKGMSGREIRLTRRISQRSIKLVRETGERVGVTWDDVADMPDGEVYDLLFPDNDGLFLEILCIDPGLLLAEPYEIRDLLLRSFWKCGKWVALCKHVDNAQLFLR